MGLVTRHAADLGLGEARGEQRIGEGLEPGGGRLVDGLAEVGAEGDVLDADRADARR